MATMAGGGTAAGGAGSGGKGSGGGEGREEKREVPEGMCVFAGRWKHRRRDLEATCGLKGVCQPQGPEEANGMCVLGFLKAGKQDWEEKKWRNVRKSSVLSVPYLWSPCFLFNGVFGG